MRNKKVLVFLLISGVLALLFVYKYQFNLQLEIRGREPIIVSPWNKTCVPQSCHVNFTCGSNTQISCTQIYIPADVCLKYQSCGVVDGKCQVITESKFTECMSCLDECKLDLVYPQASDSDCISKCGEL